MKRKSILNSLLCAFLFTFLFLFCSFPAMSQPVTLVTIGDSLTAGDGDNNGSGGYPARLLAMLKPLYPGSTLSNFAISGDTTQDLINKQLDTAIAHLTEAPRENLMIVLVWIGSNDLFGLYAGDVCSEYYSNLSTCEEMEMGYSVENLDTILRRLASTGAAIHIALLDDQTRRPVIADTSLRFETFPGITEEEVPRMAAQIAFYNEQIKTHAAMHDAGTVDFFNTTIFENSTTLDHDGNHPNSSGYDAIAQIWYQAIIGAAVPDDPDEDDTVLPDTPDTPDTPDNPDTPDTPDNPDTPDPLKMPVPSIFSGSSHDTISVSTSETVSISVSIDAGDMLNKAGDWWIIYVSPNNSIVSLTSELHWTEGIVPVLSIPLISFESIPIFSDTLTSPGLYTFYFAFDDKADGIPEAPVWLDALAVQVDESSIHPPDDNPDNSTTRLMPDNLVYQGAFSFPDGDEWAYSGHALAWYPHGDPTGSEDGYPGSLYAAAHVHGGYIGEISIPAPAKTEALIDLPKAEVIQPPADITGGWKDNCTFHPECIYRELDGLVYLSNINKIAWNLRDWYNTARFDQDSLGWSNLEMNDPQAQGVWHIGNRDNDNDTFHNAKTSNYLFKAPESFAANWLDGKWLIAGSSREGGALGGSQGPTLFALAPWEDGNSSANGNPPADDNPTADANPPADDNPPAASSNLDALALLYYPENYDCVWENSDICAYPGYRGADHWNGGAWIETASGSAVLITGRKGLGEGCYGLPEECGNDPCVTSKGYHAYPYQPQVLFYDPEALKAVRSGIKDPWQVLPYHVLSLENIAYNAGCGVIGAAAWDPDNGRLYITEKEIDAVDHGIWGGTVVHVWKIR